MINWHCVQQWFSVKGSQMSIRGHSAISGDILGCHNLGRGVKSATNISCIEPGAVTEHPTMHRITPSVKNYETHDINSAKIK